MVQRSTGLPTRQAQPPCARSDQRLHETAERIAAALEQLLPAAQTLHGFGDRADALCRWLGGRWPWIGAVALMVLGRTINAAPEELPKLLGGVADLVRALGGLG